MGFITLLKKIIDVNRHGVDLRDMEVDKGGGDIITAEHFEGAGADSNPLPEDYAYVAPIPASGRYAVLGYFDPNYKPKTEPGEKIIYARDEDGILIVEIHLKRDGEAILQNENGSFTLRPDGSQRGELKDGSGSYELKPDGSFRVESQKSNLEVNSNGSIRGANDNGSYELQTGGDFLVNTVRIDTQGNITATSVSAPSIVANSKELAEHTHGGVESGGSNTGPNQ